MAILSANRQTASYLKRPAGRTLSDRVRCFSEVDRGRQYRSVARSDLGRLRDIHPKRRRSLGRRNSVLLSNLRRFRRIQPDSTRNEPLSGISTAAEFSAADVRMQSAGVLAPLEHYALALATRLSLPAAGRESCGTLEDRRQHYGYHAARRALARRGLDLRHLGRDARSGTCGGARPGV